MKIDASKFTPFTSEELKAKFDKRAARFDSKPTVLPKAYANRVKGKKRDYLKDDPQQVYKYFLNAYKKRVGVDFVLNDGTAKIYQVLAWFAGWTEPVELGGIVATPTLDHKKGIGLFGGVGAGKTAAFEVMQTLAQNSPKRFGAVRCTVLDEQAEEGGIPALAKYKVNNFCFDDLGWERISVKPQYQTEFSPMGRVVADRERVQKEGVVTHFTTNLKPDELAERYGQRVFRRLLKSCNFLDLGEECLG